MTIGTTPEARVVEDGETDIIDETKLKRCCRIEAVKDGEADIIDETKLKRCCGNRSGETDLSNAVEGEACEGDTQGLKRRQGQRRENTVDKKNAIPKSLRTFMGCEIIINDRKPATKGEELEMSLKIQGIATTSLLLLALFLSDIAPGFGAKEFTRNDFPPDFIFGSGTSAYQVEGAANEDGRTPSIFDTSAHDESWPWGNGDVACDGYHKYKEDVQLMVDTGLDAYRFSISWSRLVPYGRGPVNPKGLAYYNNFINELLNYGIQPHVTLLHVDVPQALEDEYGGFLSRKIIKDFVAFTNVCFREFGDRVSHWTTMNEANIFVLGGYDTGQTPPKRCSPPFGLGCHAGNSTVEPYAAAHNMLLAHGSAVRLYRKKYQAKQHGVVGLGLFGYCFEPATNETEDLQAVKRANDFFLGWFMDPLINGDYPEIIKKHAGRRLPSFTVEESKLVKGSFDYIGLNHYTTLSAKDNPSSLLIEQRDFLADMSVSFIFDFPGPATEGFPVAPWGLQSVLEYFKEAYGNPPIYIHENGQVTIRNKSLNDTSRVEYLQGYIGSLLDAVRNGSNTKGYFTWSFLDVFELLNGYGSSFGLYYVDLDDPHLTRYPKSSQRWYSGFLKTKGHTKDDVSQELLHLASDDLYI